MCPRRFSASRKSPAVKYASLSSLTPQIPSSLLKRQEITVPAGKIGGIVGKIVQVNNETIVIETSADRVRVEFAKFAISTNNTAEKEAAKKRAEAAAARKEKKAKK